MCYPRLSLCLSRFRSVDKRRRDGEEMQAHKGIGGGLSQGKGEGEVREMERDEREGPRG
jgi:hypothetical protein